MRVASLMTRASGSTHDRRAEGQGDSTADVTDTAVLASDSSQSQALVALPRRDMGQGDAVQSVRLGRKGSPSSKQHSSGAFRAASRKQSGAAGAGEADGPSEGSGNVDGRMSEWKGHERIATFCVLAVILGLRDKFLMSAKGLDDVVNVSQSSTWCVLEVF